MRDLLVVVPSRGRPHSIARLKAAMDATCRAGTDLLVGLDADDPTAGDYPDGIAYTTEPDLRGAVAWFNCLSTGVAATHRAVGALGDDFVPGTTGWDVRVMEALEATPFAYGNERFPGRAPGESCCHIFCRSGIVAALGYLGPPSLHHMYVDNVWADWGAATGITYLDDVVIEHLHPAAGKAVPDETYASSSAYLAADQHAYECYLTARSGLQADIAKLREIV